MRSSAASSRSRLRAADRRHIAPAELWHRVERRAGRAEAAQQGVEGDRTDRLGARKTQPVEAFLGVKLARGQCQSQLFLNEIRLSVPAIKRRMFS